MLLLTVHAAAVWVLVGVTWAVQLVVYPAFAVVGPTAGWRRYHDRHSRAMTVLVAVPWAVQGGTLARLLLYRPAGVGLPVVLLAAGLGLLTVVVTVAVAVPLHSGLASYDAPLLGRLLRAHAVRTAAWTAGGGCAALMLLQARV